MKDVVVGVIATAILIALFSFFGSIEETTPTLTPEPEMNKGSKPAWSGDAGEIRPGEGEELVVEEDHYITSPATGDIYERRIIMIGGLILGFFLGLCVMAATWSNHERKAMRRGFIEMDGKLYRLTRIGLWDLEEEDE